MTTGLEQRVREQHEQLATKTRQVEELNELLRASHEERTRLLASLNEAQASCVKLRRELRLLGAVRGAQPRSVAGDEAPAAAEQHQEAPAAAAKRHKPLAKGVRKRKLQF